MGTAIKSWLWSWAGVDPALLISASGLTQWRYTWLGLLLTFLFVFCFFSGFFAFEWVFGHPGISVAFAVFWALVIYNLYRFLLSTVNSGLGPQNTERPQLFSLLIRYGFLVFLAMIISKPVELFAFDYGITVGMLDGNIDPSKLGHSMDVMHEQFPAVWCFTAFSIILFLWPFLLKRAFAKSCSYEQKRADVEKNIILEDHRQFNARYLDMMSPYGVMAFNGGNSQKPFENDPPSERVFQKKGALLKWAKNHIQNQ